MPVLGRKIKIQYLYDLMDMIWDRIGSQDLRQISWVDASDPGSGFSGLAILQQNAKTSRKQYSQGGYLAMASMKL
jgi:hypothetical protein